MSRNRPDILIYPPVVSLSAPVAAVALEWLAPLSLLPGAGTIWILIPGLALLVAAGMLERTGTAAFRAAGTNVDPRQDSLVLVESGPYAITRNPLYLGMVTFQLGLALTFSLDWGLFATPLVWAILHWGVVLREEAFLTDRFGADYAGYLRRTRRWL